MTPGPVIHRPFKEAEPHLLAARKCCLRRACASARAAEESRVPASAVAGFFHCLLLSDGGMTTDTVPKTLIHVTLTQLFCDDKEEAGEKEGPAHSVHAGCSSGATSCDLQYERS